jgi:CRISPR-associated endonuclease/helicase Cas3
LAPDATSQLQTVRRDYFVGNLKGIMQATAKEHLQRALFRQWDYGDALDNQSLHLDPTEDRRHAYQWSRPSGDPSRTKSGGMLGANRLAIEALPLFQSFAAGNKLMTCGFRGTRTDNTRWTWPIWEVPLDCGVIASLLSIEALQEDTPDSRRLVAAGLGTAYRCRRILVGKTPNFTPSVAVF